MFQVMYNKIHFSSLLCGQGTKRNNGFISQQVNNDINSISMNINEICPK